MSNTAAGANERNTLTYPLPVGEGFALTSNFGGSKNGPFSPWEKVRMRGFDECI
jgi:hypothetical protein